MKNPMSALVLLLTLASPFLPAQTNRDFEILSPDSALRVHIQVGAKLRWSVQYRGAQVIEPSAISLNLQGGEVLGENARVVSHRTAPIDTSFAALNYFKAQVHDRCTQLALICQGDYGVIFRAYDDAVAYRFVTSKKGEIVVVNEDANFNFPDDESGFFPYMWDYRGNRKFNSSFEALYKEIRISQFVSDSLAFLPVLVDAGNAMKAAVLEADLEDYPGMYLNKNQTGKGLVGVFAPYPLEAELGGFAGMNLIPTKRGEYIARTRGTRSFPWRVVILCRSDKELLSNDMVQRLASPPRISDVGWIVPGQVAWDWWNNWSLSHVNFRAGINTPTYKYYIDFAAANRIPYIIMDGGWSKALDLTAVAPEINVQEIVDYGKENGVGVILWASWYAVTQQMDKVFPLYSGMGVKGFKIDFVDRDDQKAVATTYDIAARAAKYHLLVDYHGVFKPTGLQRTYPNVIGYEGVKGLENVKWAVEDAPRYAVSIPFIRMLAGPMDYTPGAMRNSNRANFRPINDMPMSQGTRCHQLAMYIVYHAPLQMLADNPVVYTREQECTDFITRIPTTFDETVPLDGKVAEFAAIARRKGGTWYAGAMSNWDARELTLSLSFLGAGRYDAVVFRDGINADRDATDYRKETISVSSADSLHIQLSTGGGWAARFEKVP